MEERLKNFYTIPEQIVEQDIYLLDLSEQCAAYEERVRQLAQRLTPENRELLETYLSLRDELEFQTVKVAMKYAKKHLR